MWSLCVDTYCITITVLHERDDREAHTHTHIHTHTHTHTHTQHAHPEGRRCTPSRSGCSSSLPLCTSRGHDAELTPARAAGRWHLRRGQQRERGAGLGASWARSPRCRAELGASTLGCHGAVPVPNKDNNNNNKTD